ncbi:DNA replication licensing factor MCM5, partial [Stylophora pistillata]
MADEVTKPRPLGEEEVQDIQITLKSEANPMSVRELRATNITIQCHSCRNTISNIPLKPGLEGYAMPRKCPSDQAGRPPCPLDPFFIMPDKCKCVDFQVLKLQESPDAVPNGEMPRHMQLYCDRYLTDKVVPGNRVTVMGIYSIKKVAQKADK